MIKNPQYTFGGETSKSDLIYLRVHIKGSHNVNEKVKSMVPPKHHYPAKRVTRKCENWRHRRLHMLTGKCNLLGNAMLGLGLAYKITWYGVFFVI